MQYSLKVFKNSSINEAVLMCQRCPSDTLESYKNTPHLFTDNTDHAQLYISLLSLKSSISSLWKCIYSWPCHLMHWNLLTVERIYPIALHHPLWVSFLQTCLSHLILNNLSSLPKIDFHFGFFSYSSLSYLRLQMLSIPSPLLLLSFYIHLCNSIFNVPLHLSFSQSLFFILRSTLWISL